MVNATPVSKTPPSGWLGQVKMLGGVSLCLKVCRWRSVFPNWEANCFPCRN